MELRQNDEARNTHTNQQQAISASSPNTRFHRLQTAWFFSPANRTLTLTASLRGSENCARSAYQAGGASVCTSPSHYPLPIPKISEVDEQTATAGTQCHPMPPRARHTKAFENAAQRGPAKTHVNYVPSRKHGGFTPRVSA
ncbi:hypothetical protein BJ912DRAFT_1062854 [Pholiota molesta]|nr:hypothetical protein BJ912DRAFT_1062854 [Pholiota molesta]